jgi:hypothetical protein
MPNRTESCPAKAALRNATGRLPLVRLFSTPLKVPRNRPTPCARGADKGCELGVVLVGAKGFNSR